MTDRELELEIASILADDWVKEQKELRQGREIEEREAKDGKSKE